MIALASSVFCGFATSAEAQVLTFAGNPQHTGLYTSSAQPVNLIKWQTPIELNTNGAFAHYGMPCVTAANTVIVPVKTSTDGFIVNAFDGYTGSSKYSLTSDYILPSYSWIPVYNPCVINGPNGTRVYYAGAGGTLFYVDNADSNAPSAPVRVAFFGDANYAGNTAGFNSTVFVDTPITADANGNVFFGFRVQNTAPAPLNTTQSGYARIDPNGVGTYVLVGDAAGDANISKDSHNAAPAISNDGSTVYVVCKWATNAYYGYLLGLDSTTLATKYKVFLKDPRSNNLNNAGILDESTASPMVAPDNDVFLGVFGNPYNGSRGWLLHFSPDLTVEKTPGAFGWDFTPGIVPATMVPSYHGPSSYLIFSKYNNYANVTDGDGINKVAILDPNQTQTDPHPTAPGQIEMREVMTMIGITPDSENPTVPNAIREWCINAPMVNPSTNCVYFDSEDGHLYSWNLSTNSLSQSMVLTAGIGEPYVPTTMGPDGTIYTLNGTYLFAIGNNTNAGITLHSSSEDARTTVAGDNVTFTATVTGGATPTGTVTFTDLTYNAFTQESVTLGTVTLDANGQASISTNSLATGGAYLGNHWITASYSGDGSHAAVSATRVQKVHAFGSLTALSSSAPTSNYGDSVTFTATVSSAGGTPSGMVTFQEGNTFLGQVPLSSGVASFSTSALTGGAHNVTAVYYGDTQFATSSGTMEQDVAEATTTTVSASPNPSSYGQSVTFAATVASSNPAAGVPTGSVTFTAGAQNLGTVALDASGHASISTSALPVGTSAVTASFTGTGGWGASSGNAAGQLVTDGTSSVLSTSGSPSAYGATVTFTAAVTAADSGAGVPTGSVTFMDGASTLGSAALDGSGHAALSTSALSVGTHGITASFSGSNGWGNSGAGPVTQSITEATSLGLQSSANPSNLGQSVTFTATASSVDSGAGAPTGSVTFKDGATVLATVAASGGVATYSTSSLSLGTHTITATFGGTGGYGSSSASPISQNVVAFTSTALTSSLNPSVVGQSVTFTATVSATAGVPQGSVTFLDGATALATVPVNGSGVASYTTSALSQSSHNITANFVGTNGFQNSSNSLTQNVTADTTPPTVPSGVNASSGPAKGQITVTWSPSTDPDDAVAGYEVWSSNKSNGGFTLLATVTGTSYLDDLGKSKQTRYYYVIAFDSAGNRSAASAKVSAKSQ